jgi:hypothetical protein
MIRGRRQQVGWALAALIALVFLGGCAAMPLGRSAGGMLMRDPSPAGQTVREAPAPGAAAPGPGRVWGQLRRLDGSAVRGLLVYAGAVAGSEGARLASVDPASAPRAITDAAGAFAFDELPPGMYALVAQSPFGLILLADAGGRPVVFQVEGGQTLALGVVTVEYRFPDAD